MKTDAEIEEGWKKEIKYMSVGELTDWYKRRKALTSVWKTLVLEEYRKRVYEKVDFT